MPVSREHKVRQDLKVLRGRKASRAPRVCKAFQVLRALLDWMASSVPRGIQDRLDLCQPAH